MQGKFTSLLIGTWKTCGKANKALTNWLKETAPRSTMEYQMHYHGDASVASHQALLFTKSAIVKLVTKAEARIKLRNQVANQTQKRNKPHTKHLDEDAKTNVHEKLKEAESSSTRASQVSVSECPRERTVVTGCALKAQIVWCAPSVNCVGYVCLFPHFALSSCHGS